jgi:uncharacterized membrane protein YcaP (DUF421 family)
MESVIRGAITYLFLMLVFRIAGKRTLSETSTFDLVLVLIISETTQQAMVDGDHSMTNGALLILTLIGCDILLSLLKQWIPPLETALEGTPVILLREGKPLKDRMNRERVDEEEILEAARQQRGLERLDQVKYAVLERGGKINIIAKD